MPGWAKIYAWLWAITLVVGPGGLHPWSDIAANPPYVWAKFPTFHSGFLGIQPVVFHPTDNQVVTACGRNFFRSFHLCGRGFLSFHSWSERPADLSGLVHGCRRGSLDMGDMVSVDEMTVTLLKMIGFQGPRW